MDILLKTLNEMNFTFSSNEFAKKARKNGLTKQEVDNGAVASFLHRNALNAGSKRMWRKAALIPPTNDSKVDKINEAINLLKSKGYKIMKPVSEWIEL